MSEGQLQNIFKKLDHEESSLNSDRNIIFILNKRTRNSMRCFLRWCFRSPGEDSQGTFPPKKPDHLSELVSPVAGFLLILLEKSLAIPPPYEWMDV